MEIMTHDYKIKVTSSAIVLLLGTYIEAHFYDFAVLSFDLLMWIFFQTSDEATSGPSTPKVSGLIASYDRTVTVIAHYLSTIPMGEGRYHKE